MVDVAEVLADLNAESADVDRMVADLPADALAAPTPAAGWTIGHQIAHLAWTDAAALLADHRSGRVHRHGWRRLPDEPATYVDRGAEEFLDEPPALLARWRAGRGRAGGRAGGRARRQQDPLVRHRHVRRPRWPPPGSWRRGPTAWMSPTRSASRRAPTARLRHIAHLGHRTLGLRLPRARAGRAPRAGPARADRSRRSLWTFGPDDAADRVTGPALDFCLLVTQRRHRADLDLVADRSGRPTSGSTWRRRSPARPAPGASRRRGTGTDARSLRIGNASGFYGDRFSAWQEMLDRRPAGRAHRRLPGRAHHADPRPRPAGRPGAGLREDVPAAAGAVPRPRRRARRHGSSPTPAA